MNSDTKEVLDRMIKEKAKITKMITDEVAQKVKDMSDYDAKETLSVKPKKGSKKTFNIKNLTLPVLLFLGLANKFIVSTI